MLISGSLEKARLYIEMHSKDKDLEKARKFERGPCITISRETGAGADTVSQHLVNILQKYKKEKLPDWTVFDKNLIEKVLEDHNLPKTLSEVFDEKKYSSMISLASELLASQPPIHSLVHKIIQMILSLAEIGNVIIIGRGGNIVTVHLPNTFHVRLFGPIEERTKHVQEYYGYNSQQAAEFVKEEDEARRKFIKTYFHRQIDDPLLFHLIINTHRFGFEKSAEIIADAVMRKFPKSFNFYQT